MKDFSLTFTFVNASPLPGVCPSSAGTETLTLRKMKLLPVYQKVDLRVSLAHLQALRGKHSPLPQLFVTGGVFVFSIFTSLHTLEALK